MARRYASSGVLASTTMVLPAGSRTSRSGRRRPSSPNRVVCAVKSQWSSIPAISTTRRSWISPQLPRTAGRAQRRHQLARLGAQLRLRLQQAADLLVQRRIGPGPRLLHFLNLASPPSPATRARASPVRRWPAAASPGRRPPRSGSAPAWPLPDPETPDCCAPARRPKEPETPLPCPAAATATLPTPAQNRR